LVGALVVVQQLGMDPFGGQDALGREPTLPVGTLGNPSFTAAYIGIAAPFALYMLLSSSGLWKRGVWFVAGSFAVLGMYFTQGRAGVLAAGAGAAVLFLFTRRIGTLPKVAAVVAALLALGLMPLVIADPNDPAREGFTRAGTANYRTEVWVASVRMTMDRPALGWGPESFQGTYGSYRTYEDARRLRFTLTDKPHNVFLTWSSATGLVGLGAFLLLVGMGLVMAARTVGAVRSRRLLAAAFGAGLVAYLVQGLYSIDAVPVALMLWVSLAGIAVLGRRSRDRERESDGASPHQTGERRGIRALAAGVVVAVVVLAAIVAGLGPWRADVAIRTALGQGAEWSPETMALYERAIALNPREATYRHFAARYLEDVADDPTIPTSRDRVLLRAADYYHQAMDMNAGNVLQMLDLGRIYALLADEDPSYFSQSLQWLGEVVAGDPLNPTAHELYGSLLREWAEHVEDPGEAASLMRKGRSHSGIARGLRDGRIVEYTFVR
jgi:hypothetical protein